MPVSNLTNAIPTMLIYKMVRANVVNNRVANNQINVQQQAEIAWRLNILINLLEQLEQPELELPEQEQFLQQAQQAVVNVQLEIAGNINQLDL